MDAYSPSHPTEQDMDVATDDEGTPVKDEILSKNDMDLSHQLYSEINVDLSPKNDSKDNKHRSHKKSRSRSKDRKRHSRSSRKSRSRSRSRPRSRSRRRRKSRSRDHGKSSHKSKRSHNERHRSRSRSHNRHSRRRSSTPVREKKSITQSPNSISNSNNSYFNNNNNNGISHSSANRDQNTKFSNRSNSRFDNSINNSGNNFNGKNYDLDKSYDRKPPPPIQNTVFSQPNILPISTLPIQHQQPPPAVVWPMNSQPNMGVPFPLRPGFPGTPGHQVIRDPMLPAIYDPTVPPPPPPPISSIEMISRVSGQPPPPPPIGKSFDETVVLPSSSSNRGMISSKTPNILETLISQAGLSLPDFPPNRPINPNDVDLRKNEEKEEESTRQRNSSDDVDYDNDENDMSPLKRISSLLNNAASNLLPSNNEKFKSSSSKTDCKENSSFVDKNETSSKSINQSNVDWKAIAQLYNRSDFATNREWQDRIALEVKSYLKPAFMAKKITKDDYMEIMKKSVTKISRSGIKRIETEKIGNFVKLYIKKYRRVHKKEDYLNLMQQNASDNSKAHPLPMT